MTERAFACRLTYAPQPPLALMPESGFFFA